MSSDAARQETIAQLRQLIAGLDGAPRVRRRCLPTGLAALDRALGGWPAPGLAELSGRPGSGRLSLALPAVAEQTRRDQVVAVVDPLGRIFPPGWTGVVLERLLVVQPNPEQAGWTAEQIARSGAVPLLLLLDPPRLGKAGARLARAAEQGDCTVLLFTERSDAGLPADLRLELRGRDETGLRLHLQRHRGGVEGGALRVELGGLGHRLCQ